MPLVRLDRFPLPSLRTYTVVSVVFLSISVYHAVQVSSDHNWKVNSSKVESGFEHHENSSQEPFILSWNKPENETITSQIQEAARFMLQEPFSIWVS